MWLSGKKDSEQMPAMYSSYLFPSLCLDVSLIAGSTSPHPHMLTLYSFFPSFTGESSIAILYVCMYICIHVYIMCIYLSIRLCWHTKSIHTQAVNLPLGQPSTRSHILTPGHFTSYMRKRFIFKFLGLKQRET